MSKKEVIETVDDLILQSSITDIRILDYNFNEKKILKGIILLNDYNVWIEISNKTKLKDFLYSKKYKINEDELFLNLISEKYLNERMLYKKKNYIIFSEFNTCKNYMINLKDYMINDIMNENYITRNNINESKKINLYKFKKDEFIDNVKKQADFLKKYFKKEHLDNVIKVVNNIFKEDYERIKIEDYKEMELSNAYSNNVTTLNFSEILLFLLKFLGLLDEEVYIVNNIFLNRNIKPNLKYVIIYFEEGKRPDELKINQFIEETEKKINHKLNTIIYCNYGVCHPYKKINDDNNYIDKFYNKKVLFEYVENEGGYPKNYTILEKYSRFYRYNLQRNELIILYFLALILISKENDEEN